MFHLIRPWQNSRDAAPFASRPSFQAPKSNALAELHTCVFFFPPRAPHDNTYTSGKLREGEASYTKHTPLKSPRLSLLDAAHSHRPTAAYTRDVGARACVFRYLGAVQQFVALRLYSGGCASSVLPAVHFIHLLYAANKHSRRVRRVDHSSPRDRVHRQQVIFSFSRWCASGVLSYRPIIVPRSFSRR